MNKTESSVVEIEVNSNLNHNLFFAPLQRRIRGRFDLNRVAEPKAKMLTNDWPEPIPGQRIGFDLSASTGFIAESLHEQQHSATRKRIERRGQQIAASREDVVGAHQPTWLFWMQKAVQAGYAQLTKGQFPSDLGGEPQKSFITQPQKSAEDRLAAAIERQTEMFGELVKAIKLIVASK